MLVEKNNNAISEKVLYASVIKNSSAAPNKIKIKLTKAFSIPLNKIQKDNGGLVFIKCRNFKDVLRVFTMSQT